MYDASASKILFEDRLKNLYKKKDEIILSALFEDRLKNLYKKKRWN